ncbi:hypothetical protein BVI2075_220050 [Burkholderia vietnamiensis]|nr:hypothetical protein BVI2075_220050 [Burkholderia vietnamiensis]CAG9214973.1 hypothetical protein BVI1335_2610014 [Burkholderia vietnamiensis]
MHARGPYHDRHNSPYRSPYRNPFRAPQPAVAAGEYYNQLSRRATAVPVRALTA